MKMHLFLPAVVIIASFSLAKPVLADAFLYQDDFQTDKAMVDSWRHSRFAPYLPGVSLWGFLYYQGYPFPPSVERGLGFYPGFEAPTAAYLGYAVVPQGMTATEGSVSFQLQPNANGDGQIGVWGSSNGVNWSLLGQGQMPGNVSVPIFPDSPARFIELRGVGLIDNLGISVSYVPEPSTFTLVALGSAALMISRRRK